MPSEPGDGSAILIVDDRPQNLVALEAILEPFQHRVVRASSGDQALKNILREDFAAIILDVEMPGLDGFQTAQLIRERERSRHVPILFVTAALREEADLLKAYAQGAVDYVLKPIDPDILRAKVRTMLELHARAERIKRQEALRKAAETERDRLFHEEKAARADADSRQAQLQSLFMNAPFPLALMKGADLVHELVNPLYRRLFAGRELIGKPIRAALPELMGHGLVEIAEGVFRSGQTFVGNEYPVKIHPADGEAEERLFNLVIQPVHESENRIAGVLTFGSDVTDQVLSRRRVEDAVRVRDDFLSIASHELKTPLTPLELKVTSLLRRAEANLHSSVPAERVVRDLQVAQRQIRKLTELIHTLLDDSRISAGKLQLSLEDVNLAAVAQDVASRFQQQAIQAGCRIEVHCDNPIVIGRWDALRIEQIVTNLLTNAMKYGAGKPVFLKVESVPEWARLTVRDGGIGIDPKDQSRIFERFERAVSDRHYGGMGLGLYISRRLVAAHGGDIRVESKPGQGSTFIVELPRAPLASEQTPRTALAPHPR